MIVTVILMNGCKKKENTPAASSSPGTNEGLIQNNMFNPATITIAVNTTIKWTNKDPATHTVTSNGGLFDSGNISSNSTYSHQFTTMGTFPYKCNIHSSMAGTIIVQ